jgi:hypothetical protein
MIGSIQLMLLIGPGMPVPASARLMGALRGVEVTQRDTAPSAFQLTFSTEVEPGGAFLISDDPFLQPFMRVFVGVLVDGMPTGLIDGFITHQQHLPANDARGSTFVVTGQDVSVKLDLVLDNQEYPAMCDDEIVPLILEPWDLLGIIPLIVPGPTMVPVDHVPQQAETDRAMLARLAARNGYVFFIRAGVAPFLNIAYWGPPPRFEPPTAVLDVAVGSASTVDGLQAAYDALAPVTYFGEVLDTLMSPATPVPVLTTMSTRLPPLALVPALSPLGLLTLTNRHELWSGDEFDPIVANLRAQAMTDLSSDKAVTVTCEVAVPRLGQIVTAPGVVGVRGAGLAYDGLYYLSSATHSIALTSGQGWNYTQHLEMSREGVGSTTPLVVAL